MSQLIGLEGQLIAYNLPKRSVCVKVVGELNPSILREYKHHIVKPYKGGYEIYAPQYLLD